MLTWLAPIIVFGLVVFVHELGHFLAAKAVGIYAPRFSIGFGPALLRKRWGETEYVIAALPLGGYVRMASREDETMALLEGGGERPPDEPHTVGGSGVKVAEEHIAQGMRPDEWDPEALVPFGPKPVPAHRWFESKRLPARLFVLIAGVSMNVLLTFVVSVASYAYYGEPFVPPVVDSLAADRPAARAGLVSGDSIAAVDGTPIRRWSEVVTRVSTAAGDTVALTVVRDGAPRVVRVVPEVVSDTSPFTGEVRTVGRIGAMAPLDRVSRDDVSFGEAVTGGARRTWNLAVLVVGTVKGLLGGAVSVGNLGGPIAIAQSSVEAARGGFETLVGLIGFLSINIAILNLLPIPILDGGQILLNVAESVKGRPFSARTREAIARVGLLAIALLFAVVMFNDFRRLVQSVFG
jgi:regulator of sigma E protease